MNFYNIFTNISQTNPNASKYLNLIENLLLTTSSEGITDCFSKDFVKKYSEWSDYTRNDDK